MRSAVGITTLQGGEDVKRLESNRIYEIELCSGERVP